MRKIGAPGHEELALGAITEGEPGALVLNADVVAAYGLTGETIEELTSVQRREIARRAKEYRMGSPAVPLAGRDVILVDDGFATGATMKAVIKALRQQGVAHLTVALPVAPADALPKLDALADEVVCLKTPPDFFAVGQAYRDFRQLDDGDVTSILNAFKTGH